MSLTFAFFAPTGVAPTISCRSGNSYSPDANSVVKSVVPGDVLDLLQAGCVALGQSQAKSNFAATTNPGVSNDNTQDYGIGSSWYNKSTGVEWRATSVATGAATWIAINGSYLGLPWVTGRFYGLPPGSTQAAVLTVLGTLYAYPIFIPSTIALNTINVSVTTGQTGGKVRCALFADNGAGYPGAIVTGSDSGDLTATGTAVATSSALALAVNPGWYWLGTIATASSTMPSVIGATATYPDFHNALLGCDTAAHALATASDAVTGISITGQTYPATNMATSFATFPASAALQLNVTTPIAALSV